MATDRPACGGQPLQMGGAEFHGGGVTGPAVFGPDEHRCGLIAILRLAGDVAHGLVEQDGDLALLVRPGGRIDLYARLGRHPHPQGVDDLAVNPDPAVDDPGFGLAARAQAQFAHALGKAGIVGTHRGPLMGWLSYLLLHRSKIIVQIVQTTCPKGVVTEKCAAYTARPFRRRLFRRPAFTDAESG